MGSEDDERKLTPEEAKLWDKVTERDRRWKEVAAPETPTEEPGQSDPVPPQAAPNAPKPTSFTIKESPQLQIGEMHGVDGRTAERLKRGKLKIEATLDMHGLTQSEAMYALRDFIKQNSRNGRRCILVITGKGTRPDGSPGVLRQRVPQWLNESDIRPLILAFNYAHPKDGGNGAIYILLKRTQR